jgi:ABC-2 type transport system permease protein
MNELVDMVWVEFRKATRSRMPLWTALGSLFIPLGIGFLIFVSKNPKISQELGLVGAKANLLQYSTIDWPTYLDVFGQIVAIAGFMLFVLVISWIFGREYVDGTLKDLLAVPVQRSSIILAKFILLAAWSILLTLVIFIAGLILGVVLKLTGISPTILINASVIVLTTAIMTIVVVLPFALLASIGRGYLFPIGVAILTLMAGNLAHIIGRGEYFPWAVPGLYAQGKSPLSPISYWIILLSGLAGMLATYLWWKYADQNR